MCTFNFYIWIRILFVLRCHIRIWIRIRPKQIGSTILTSIISALIISRLDYPIVFYQSFRSPHPFSSVRIPFLY
jgi:hypothetical protein